MDVLRNFWFPVFLTAIGLVSLFIANYQVGNGRRVMLSMMGLLFFMAYLSYLWGDPVRGPFAGITSPKAPDKFRFHAGMTMIFPVMALSRGIEFSKIISMPNNPIKLTISRTWWSGWAVNIELIAGSDVIKVKNKQIENIPTGWDYNSDDNAIEIVDETKTPVFQVIQDRDYDIYVNAIMANTINGVVYLTILKGDRLLINAPLEKISPDDQLSLIFKYPSYIHRGRRL